MPTFHLHKDYTFAYFNLFLLQIGLEVSGFHHFGAISYFPCMFLSIQLDTFLLDAKYFVVYWS